MREYIVFLLIMIKCCSAIGNCRDGWQRFEDKCYLFSHNLLSWPDAAETCEVLHGSLAEVQSASEQNFLKSYLMKLHASDAASRLYWLDGTDLEVEHTWKLISTGENLSYTDWAPGEPTNTENENCLVLWGQAGFQMGDNPCYVRWNYICQQRIDEGEELIG